MTGGCGHRAAFARAFLAAILGAMLVSAPGYAAEREVLVVDGAYEPGLVKIEAGDTIVWRWGSHNARFHTVTALDGRFDSDSECAAVAACRTAGNDFTWTFSQPGIYVYRCKVEPVMLGRVEVAEAKSQEPAPQPPPSSGGQQQQQPQTKARPRSEAGRDLDPQHQIGVLVGALVSRDGPAADGDAPPGSSETCA